MENQYFGDRRDNYLRATPVEVGLLLNFEPKPQFNRFVFANERKKNPRSSA